MRQKRVLLLGVVLVGASFLAAFHFRRAVSEALAERLLSEPESLVKSDVIYVMGGDPTLRLTYAVDLFEKGYGSRLWCATTKVRPSEAQFARRFGVRADEETLVTLALTSAVPPGKWKVLAGSTSTWTDILLLKDALEKEPAASVLVVSSPSHFRRIGYCIRKIFKDSPIRFHYAYPSVAEMDASGYSPENLPEKVAVELMKNVGYRLKYGL